MLPDLLFERAAESSWLLDAVFVVCVRVCYCVCKIKLIANKKQAATVNRKKLIANKKQAAAANRKKTDR